MESSEPGSIVGEYREKKNEQQADSPVQQENVEIQENFETKDIKAPQASPERVGGLLPFRKWVNSFRVKKTSSLYQPQPYVEGWSDISHSGYSNISGVSPHDGSFEQQWERLSGNSSNLGTVKTATLSFTSQSLIRSRRTTRSTTNRSIKSDFRASIDSLRPPLNPSIDEEAQNRALKRRQVLREIITTESDYISGLKTLADVLLILSARPEIYHNVQQIRETHEEFLGRIQCLTPMSSISGPETNGLILSGVRKRASTVDLSLKALQNRSLRTRNFKATINYRLKVLSAEANEALEVAREIGRLATSFTAYKQFCNNYELLTKDAAILRDSIPNWAVFEQGIEALAKSGASMESKVLYENKSLHLNDLLVKPAQRLCKYPLLLQELLKWTHIQDDPSAHDEIGHILDNFRKALNEINEATTKTLNEVLVQKTFLLQGMLDFSEPNICLDIYKQLGPMSLCGVLHVTYQESRHITGTYMVCVLFKHHFFLAEMKDEYRKLRPIACLYICDAKIDSLSNGKGLECFCLFSWKLVFRYDESKFEFILSASSAGEEMEWKTKFLKSAAALADVHSPVSTELRGNSFLSLELTPLEHEFSTAPQLLRRPSLHSLAISRSSPDAKHVIIRKTHCPQRHGQTHQIDGEIERPKFASPMSATVLTTRRQERIRLERAIYSIYTRDKLPYPGMSLARGDVLFGSGSIMRHLSLRHKRYRRSTSVNLPSTAHNQNDSRHSEKPVDKMQEFDRKKRRGGTELSLGYDDEKALFQQQESFPMMDQSRIGTQRSGSKSVIGRNNIEFSSQWNKNTEHAENLSLKTIRSMFNSMSLRKTRKNPRPTLGGV